MRSDTLQPAADTLHPSDTLKPKKAPKKSQLKSKVEYAAKDSLRFDIKNQKVHLYNNANIKYEDIELQSGYVEIDFPKATVHATGIVKDTVGDTVQMPEFTQAAQKFKSNVMNYNYNTKRGYIQNVFTKQDEGYLHGTIVKKMENDITYLKNGWYTTCDREADPHFEFKFGKAKVIPGKRVITGPAYFVVADVPIPIGIPFGYFPSKSGRRSGIIVPTYGESASRGFFLENGGYYWAMSEYTDLYLVGDIYSHGSWAIKPRLNYRYRYHYSGTFNMSYANNKIGTQDSPDYSKSTDYSIQWVHAQDPKARPHSTFSANVNIVSHNFNKYNPVTNTEAYLSNTFQSSVNFSTSFSNTTHLTVNFSHSQNTLTRTIDITLPYLTFSVDQFYPLRKKNRAGKIRWFENISTKYNLEMQNQYNTTDTTIFKKQNWWNDMQNGIRHSVPITGTFRVLKYLNWTNSILMNDRMYLSTIRKQYIPSSVAGKDSLVTDTIHSFANAFDANVSTALNTRLYGMYQFKKGPIVAIRHMVTPTVSFTYTPDFGSSFWGYYRYADNDTNSNPQKYSIFQGSLYGSPPPKKSGLVAFSLSNNLEMKVRSKKDTVTGTKKIVLIEDLTFRETYDLAKDTMKWSKFSISGYTTLFKSLRIQYNSTWDPYARDSTGHSINKTEWAAHRRLLRLDNTTWDVGLNYSLSSDKSKKKKTTTKGTPQERKEINDYYDYYIDFDIPWSFNVAYKFNYTKTWNSGNVKRVGQITQTLGFNGQLNITPKWKITLNTGWDFTSGQLAFTSIDLYRDLHCWEMRFGWIPKGAQQSWNFSINVKASVLQDLKLNKKKDFRDYVQ
ncbi:MAG: putative LPS assembly protein LptD [Bacteroidetes bacterium]|nr:putative LPS assembly protein LptD [Bacteroidota bacterium]